MYKRDRIKNSIDDTVHMYVGISVWSLVNTEHSVFIYIYIYTYIYIYSGRD